MIMSLLNQAKESPARLATRSNIKKFDQDEVLELVVSLLHGEVTFRQACAALEVSTPGNITHLIPSILRKGLESGKIEIKLI